MVHVPAGPFIMGSNIKEAARVKGEQAAAAATASQEAVIKELSK